MKELLDMLVAPRILENDMKATLSKEELPERQCGRSPQSRRSPQSTVGKVGAADGSDERMRRLSSYRQVTPGKGLMQGIPEI